MPPPITTRPATVDDLADIQLLHAEVFGPGRFVRTAYRVREGTPDLSPFCRVALAGDRIIAALRLTEVTIGAQRAALLLGPLAVAPDYKGQGYGRQLVAECLREAKAAGVALIVLVGDEPYYGKLGFQRVPPGQISLPGPVDPLRLLAAELTGGALAAARGVVRARAASAV
jgi:predicted N-acetyltransferase YhbS